MVILNIAESKRLALDLIVESVVNGVAVPTAKNNDYLLLHNMLANIAQCEIATVKKIHSKYSITRNPIPNQLGEHQGFDILQHLATDNIITQAIGSRAYYFEVDNVATIYIEEKINDVWTVLETIEHSMTTTETYTAVSGFTAYKGFITPSSDTNYIRVRFSGNYPYNIRNRALYGYTFPTKLDIPNYTPYVAYDMPLDFMELNKVVFKGDNQVYDNYMAYKWEGRRTIVFGYYESGSFDILYYKYPTTIKIDSPDTTEFEVDIEAQPLIPMYIASKWVAEEKPTMSAILFNEYRLKLSQLSDIDVIGDNVTISVDGW